MTSLVWFKSFHSIIQRQCIPQYQTKTFVRVLSSYRPKTKSRRQQEPKDDPYYEFTEEDPPEDPTLITVPLKLKGRLDKKMENEATKYGQKMKLLEYARQGSRSKVVISAKNPELNHYKGQNYGRQNDRLVLPMISKGWKHKKSKGDFFTIHAAYGDTNFMQIENRETFALLGLRKTICEVLEAEKIKAPTVIQATAIPEILKRKNNLLAAETGCGKTLAYLLPIFEQILEKKSIRHPRKENQPLAVVIVPTRELAEQVSRVALKMGRLLDIQVRLVQGGNVRGKVNNPTTKPYDILVTTISIVSTLHIMDALDLSRVNHLVLDEADTLLDDSFSAEVIRFLHRFNFTSDSLQATLVSATMPRSIETILGEAIPFDSLHRITTPGLHTVVKTVPQEFLRVRKMDKPSIILNLLKEATYKKLPTVVFCNKGVTCHWVGMQLNKNGIDNVCVHGGIRPGERRGLLEQYQEGDINALVCTDIGSRGIDTIRTKRVINYEFPKFVADYVHRCGRVGRVGSGPGGKVINLISSGFEIECVNEIETAVRKDESLEKVNANIKRILNARYGMYKTIDAIGPDEE